MKQALLLLLLLTVCHLLPAQKNLSKLDSLHSRTDIEKLIRSFTAMNKSFTLKPVAEVVKDKKLKTAFKKLADSLGVTKSYYKSDFDHNGYTDLLVTGECFGLQVFVVMSFGKDSFNLCWLTGNGHIDCAFPKMLNDTVIRYFFIPDPHYQNPDWHKSLQYKDLVYQYGGFIEQDRLDKKYAISKIEFKAGLCYGLCPEFSLTIDSGRQSVLKAIQFNFREFNSTELKGTFKTTITDSAYSTVTGLLQYINFPGLNDYYPGYNEHSSTRTTIITYDNGKIKTIEDDGSAENYGLRRLYNLFFDLRFNQDWK
ncbi:MAG: hypothetical protein JST86_15000 [Bacteroidetes bacterium]|nr:hypothetical protein [Bacteroidota bacterium]